MKTKVNDRTESEVLDSKEKAQREVEQMEYDDVERLIEQNRAAFGKFFGNNKK